MTIINELRPAWRVLDPNGFFSDDLTLYKEGSEIYFDGEPNDQLEPLNILARDKLVAYLEGLEQLGKEAAEKAGRKYAGRPRTLDGAITLATAVQKAEMSTLGPQPKNASTEAIEKPGADDTGLAAVKRGRGRPRRNQVAA